MQSDKQNTPNSDLHSARIDGAKTFHDRKRTPSEAIRSSLDSEPRVGLEGPQDVAQENIQPNAPIEEIGIEIPGASEVSQDHAAEKDTVQQRGVGPESNVEPTEMPEGPGAGVEGRSRVRSLLGIPESESGNLASSPTSPPVGFRYADDTFTDAPYLTTQPPPSETTRSVLDSEPQVGRQSQDVAQENIQPHTPIERTNIETSGISESSQGDAAEKETGQSKVLIKDTARQREAEPESKQEQVFVKPTEKSEKLDAGIEQASIEIPDVSGKKQSFPALSPAKKGDTPSDKTEVRAQQEVPPTGSRGDFVRTSLSEAKENAPVIDSMRTSEGLQKAEVVKERMAVTPLPSRRENPITGDVEAVKSDVKTAIKHELSSQRKESLPVGPEERSKFRPRQAPGASASQYVDTDTINQSNRDAAERIEQLRRTVQELTSKVSTLQARTNNETKQQQPEQTPPPPTQPVVIIKRASNQARTPCAFWERSYLSRFHLRTLR